MKLHVISDLHTELLSKSSVDKLFKSLRAKYDSDKPDVLVLAGDIWSLAPNNLNKARAYRDALLEIYPTIVYTPGNHEMWGTSIREGHLAIRSMETDNFIPLFPGEPRTVLGKKFAGGTLWYPNPGPDFLDRRGFFSFIDFQRVDDGDPEIFREHQKFLDSTFEEADIVVSHHFPTPEAIDPMWAHSAYNVFFCSFSEDRLAAGAPKELWLFGHTHNPFDFISEFGPRFYCNPMGYEGEGMNPRFYDRILVDTDAK